MRITDILMTVAIMFVLPLILALALLTVIRWEAVKLKAYELCDRVASERELDRETCGSFEESVRLLGDACTVAYGCIRKTVFPGEEGNAEVYTQKIPDSGIRECIDRNGRFKLSRGELFTVTVTFAGNGLWERFARDVTGVTVPVCCACAQRTA